MSLKDKVEGNELDLSLNQLTDVPVKELAATPKATHLDLSCNRIETLPNDFATLTHLVKIDLSRNKLTQLPPNFGNLLNLQHLDLDRNELKTVPLSFSRLKNLRWLDLKDNPLVPKLKAIAGDCLDVDECHACAKKVVAYMQSIQSNLERERQKHLKEVREKEALEKAKIEKELEEQRLLKKMERERRKAESKARNAEEKLKQYADNEEKDSNSHETNSSDSLSLPKNKGLNWYLLFLPLLFIIIAVSVYNENSWKGFCLQNFSVTEIKSLLSDFSSRISKISVDLLHYFIIPFLFNFKLYVLKIVHSTMIYISNFASSVEMYFSIYF